MGHSTLPSPQFSTQELLVDGAAALGIILTASQTGKFIEYIDFLSHWNNKINLTRIIDPFEIVVKHFLDSLLYLKGFAPFPGMRLLDLGSGAGFPGVPLKIAEPKLEVTLLDAREKKVLFLRLLLRRLRIKGVSCLHDRAEKLGNIPCRQGGYQVVVTRALAPLEKLITLGLPFLRPGGRLVVSKGPGVEPELDRVYKASASRGMQVAQVIRVPLPFSQLVRTLLVLTKH